jgi:FkbM family methyltransferase
LVEQQAAFRSVAKRIPFAVKAVRTTRRLRTEWTRSIRIGEARVDVPRDMRWTVAGGEHYERNVTELLDRLVTMLEKPVIYDVGASYGFYTIRFVARCEWVYAFEPVKSTFEILARNIDRNLITNATAFRVGLANTDAETLINLYSSSGSNSLVWTLPPDHPAQLVGRELIRVAKLDDFVSRKGLSLPTLMKLDIEGAELEALRGAHDLISGVRPVLVLESSNDPWVNETESRAALLDEMFQQGYVVAGLSKNYDDFELHPIDEFKEAMVVNILAIPRERTDLLEGMCPLAARVMPSGR